MDPQRPLVQKAVTVAVTVQPQATVNDPRPYLLGGRAKAGPCDCRQERNCQRYCCSICCGSLWAIKLRNDAVLEYENACVRTGMPVDPAKEGLIFKREHTIKEDGEWEGKVMDTGVCTDCCTYKEHSGNPEACAYCCASCICKPITFGQTEWYREKTQEIREGKNMELTKWGANAQDPRLLDRGFCENCGCSNCFQNGPSALYTVANWAGSYAGELAQLIYMLADGIGLGYYQTNSNPTRRRMSKPPGLELAPRV